MSSSDVSSNLIEPDLGGLQRYSSEIIGNGVKMVLDNQISDRSVNKENLAKKKSGNSQTLKPKLAKRNSHISLFSKRYLEENNDINQKSSNKSRTSIINLD